MADEPSVTDLREARWQAGDRAQGLPPEDALHAALRFLAKGDTKPLHVVVCVAEQDGASAITHVFSSGVYNRHGSAGLAAAAAQALLE